MSVDVFRGLVMMFMMWTEAPGSHWPALRHPAWDGWTPADFISPGFLFISGVSLSFLLRGTVGPDKKVRLLRRVIALFVLGAFYNSYGASGADLSVLRLTGVLQMIGITGGATAAVVLLTRRPDGTDRVKVLSAIALGIPFIYGVGLAIFSYRCPEAFRCNPFYALDRLAFGAAHTYREGRLAYDPEGLSVAFASTAIVLAGYLCGLAVRHGRRAGLDVWWRLCVGGGVLIAIARLVAVVQPINKKLGSPAYVLVVVGVALVLLGLLVRLLDHGSPMAAERPVWMRGVTHPLVILGRNALVVYLAERVVVQSMRRTVTGDGFGDVVTLERWLLHGILGGGPGAELMYSLALFSVVLAVSYGMHALKWRIAL